MQRYFTRRLIGFKNYSYSERLVCLNLDSLELRRIKNDLKMYYKILNNLVDIDKDAFFKPVNKIHDTRGHNFKLIKPFCVTYQLANMFTCRVIDCWNWLPTTVVNSVSINSFCNNLDKLDFVSFLKGRALENL